MVKINDESVTREGPKARTVSRRSLAKGAAWTLPVLTIAAEAPVMAASGETVPSQFSSWGTTGADRDCDWSGTNQYRWYIDNSSGVSYHGVLFPHATAGQTYSDVVNVYYLPFDSGSVSGSGGGSWSTLAYDSAYPTVTGPGGATYYPWVTSWTGGPVTITAGDIDNNGVFHMSPDYHFTVTAHTSFSGQLWVSHEYQAKLNGQFLPCGGSVNNNYCGGTADYPGTSNGDNDWRNNGWVGPLTRGCSGYGGYSQKAQSKAVPSGTSGNQDSDATGDGASEGQSPSTSSSPTTQAPPPTSDGKESDSPVLSFAII